MPRVKFYAEKDGVFYVEVALPVADDAEVPVYDENGEPTDEREPHPLRGQDSDEHGNPLNVRSFAFRVDDPRFEGKTKAQIKAVVKADIKEQIKPPAAPPAEPSWEAL